MNIECLPAFKDNYIWLIIDQSNKTVVAVDPGDSVVVENYLDKHRLLLTDILLTHHHSDHVGGVINLARRYQVNVYGPRIENIQGVTHALDDNQEIYLQNIQKQFKILSIPGHTRGHIAYYSSADKLVFCGDTLFAAGCGRIFEGTASQMYQSLQKLNSLPSDTLVYCAHEYTLNNLKFARTIEPENIEIKTKILAVNKSLAHGKPSVPTRLVDERKYNPFLRCKQPELIKNIILLQKLAADRKCTNINNAGVHEDSSSESTKQFEDELEIFTYLRKLKDNF